MCTDFFHNIVARTIGSFLHLLCRCADQESTGHSLLLLDELGKGTEVVLVSGPWSMSFYTVIYSASGLMCCSRGILTCTGTQLTALSHLWVCTGRCRHISMRCSGYTPCTSRSNNHFCNTPSSPGMLKAPVVSAAKFLYYASPISCYVATMCAPLL